MSINNTLPKLKEDPTFDEVKKWSAESAQSLSNVFIGHNKAAILIVVSVLYDVIAKTMIDDCQNDVMKMVTSGKLSDSEKLQMQEYMEKVMSGESEFDLKSAFGLDQNLGEALAHITVAKAMSESQFEVSRIKFMIAAGLLSQDEKANSINELGWVFGYEEMSPDEKLELRNQLKGGTTDPLHKPSKTEMEDTFDQLFG